MSDVGNERDLAAPLQPPSAGYDKIRPVKILIDGPNQIGQIVWRVRDSQSDETAEIELTITGDVVRLFLNGKPVQEEKRPNAFVGWRRLFKDNARDIAEEARALAIAAGFNQLATASQ